jgi:hypothetical protein
MKATIRIGIAEAVAVVLALCLSGCVTSSTLDHARDQSHTDSNGEPVVTRKGKPGYYALLPLTVPADVVLSPVYVGEFLYVWFVQSFL